MADKIPVHSGMDIGGSSTVAGDLHVDGNIIIPGTVDGVDVSQLKQDFDTHNHDGVYATVEDLNNLTVGEGEFLPITGGQLTGDLDVEGKIFDIDGNSQDRSVSDTLDLLLKTLPATYDPLASGEITSTLSTGRLSDGSATGYDYSIYTIGSTITDITFDAIHYFVGASTEFSRANTGIIRVLVNGIEQYNLDLTGYSPDGSPGTSAPTGGYPSSGIRVTLLEKHPNFDSTPWFDVPEEYTRGNCNITVPNTSLRDGSNTIRVEHVINSSVVGSTQDTVFYDAYTTQINLTGQSLTVDTINNQRHLSGVPFAGTNTVLRFVVDINNFFGASYPTGNVISLSSGALGISNTYSYTDGNGYTAPHPIIGEGVHMDKLLTVSRTSKALVTNASIVADASSNNGTRDAAAITTYGANPIRFLFGNSVSGDTSEDLYSELYRIPAASLDTYKGSPLNAMPSGLFNSGAVLATDELQVYAGTLIYPKDSYAATIPAGPNYTLYTGQRFYGRAFNGFSPAEAGGIITINGITYSDISSGNVSVEICMPGITGWGTLAAEYLNPVNSDGDGCWYRAAGDGSGGVFGFFLGHNFSEGGSQNAILVRISIAESAKNSITIGTISVGTLY